MHNIEPSDLKLKPILAGPFCLTSNLIDTLLKPSLRHVKRYVKDSLDFLSKCSRESYEDTLPVKFDVVNLYTNIPHTSYNTLVAQEKDLFIMDHQFL